MIFTCHPDRDLWIVAQTTAPLFRTTVVQTLTGENLKGTPLKHAFVAAIRPRHRWGDKGEAFVWAGLYRFKTDNTDLLATIQVLPFGDDETH